MPGRNLVRLPARHAARARPAAAAGVTSGAGPDDPHGESRVVRSAPWAWMLANGLPRTIPDDAELDVDEVAGTITVEVFATGADDRPLIHAREVMTRVEVFPLKVPPPPGLLAAYQHTTGKIRARRGAADAIRYETALAVVAAITRAAIAAGDDGADASFVQGRLAARDDVWAAVGMLPGSHVAAVPR